MKKSRIFLTLCSLTLFSYTANAFADLSSRDDLLETQDQEKLTPKTGQGETQGDKNAIGAKRVHEDPTEHSLAHNTHQATRSILHDTHQGTKAIVHGTSNGIKEGTNFVTSSIADGVSKGSSAVANFFGKIGGN
ncbi:hypothetical protein FAI41_03770 [Acetobacteraceae bacterium]|nr:hypothetical protein FAI41_03770 [Acetobacteraceae bacterium]